MFPEACREDRLRAGLCSVRRQLLLYSGFVASHLSCTYVRADIERKPADKQDITTSARHACVWGRTCVHVVVRAAAVAALCHVRPYVPRRRCLRTYVRTYVLP